ncbi:uncharacterized protein LOC144129806 [Amblyomma americanum]
MATRGFPNQIQEFNGSSWVGRLQFYFEANNITDPALKRANLLTLCGEQTYDTVCALIQPSTPAAVTYDDIVAPLQKHYDPRPSEVYSRAGFQRRDQLEGETVSVYIAALKKLAAHCNFGTLTTTATRQERDTASSANTTMLPLDVMLRDRFVCGLSDESLQQRMFAEKDLTFNKACDIAFLKARPVPFALRASVEKELDKLEQQGVIEPTQHSQWATPLVVVRKENGAIRLCGDYRSTVNLATKASSYPLPTPEEVFKGIHPTEDKVRAITEARALTNKQELQAFLELSRFYDRFLEQRATVANDLYQLLRKDVTWTWSPRHQRSFDALKDLLRRCTVLQHYDERKPLLLACDASPYGVGAVLSQTDDQGREAPIAFASRTLSQAERNYARLDKEGLAIVYAATHFRQYIAGRKVTFITDHRPLLGILGPKNHMPSTLSPRMTRWCIKLSAYDYDLVYRSGNKHQNADALSRLPLDATVDEPPPPGDVLMFEALPDPPLTAATVAASTQKCASLRLVYTAVQQGNVHKLKEDNFDAYRRRTTDLSTHRGCIIFGSRVVITRELRAQAMSLIHAGHRGIVAMKKCA